MLYSSVRKKGAYVCKPLHTNTNKSVVYLPKYMRGFFPRDRGGGLVEIEAALWKHISMYNRTTNRTVGGKPRHFLVFYGHDTVFIGGRRRGGGGIHRLAAFYEFYLFLGLPAGVFDPSCLSLVRLTPPYSPLAARQQQKKQTREHSSLVWFSIVSFAWHHDTTHDALWMAWTTAGHKKRGRGTDRSGPTRQSQQQF